MLAVESADSIHLLYKRFLSKVTQKSLNAFYYACSYAKIDCSGFMNVTVHLALQLISKLFAMLHIMAQKGIETLVSLINISYCAMKILPYKDETFAQYKDISVQELRLALSEQINQQVIFAAFVENVETTIKLNVIIKAIKSALLSFRYHG